MLGCGWRTGDESSLCAIRFKKGERMDRKRIKMVVTDLDDTLLSPEKEISEAAVRMIDRLKERGISFTLITGRPPYAWKRFMINIAVTAPLVGCNGAVILDPQSQQILKGHPLFLAPLRPLLTTAAKAGLTVLVLADQTEYALSETSWTRIRKEAGRPYPVISLEYLPKTSAIYKVNIMAGDKTQQFEALLPKLAELGEEYSISLYGRSGCELVAGNVNKLTGLLELCRLCQLDPEAVLAIGDNENDIEMLQGAGIGAAVQNATTAAKAAADYICERTYTEGVIEAVNKFVLPEEDLWSL